jgi:hypothetical protein
VLLGGVAGERRELGLPGEDVVVPAPCEGVLLRRGDGLQLLEDLDIGLRRGVAATVLVIAPTMSLTDAVEKTTVRGATSARFCIQIAGS